MSIATEIPSVDDRDLIDDLGEVRFGGPMVDVWLETMWGIRPGKSSPVTQPLAEALDAGIAEWLYRFWGLAPRPEPADPAQQG